MTSLLVLRKATYPHSFMLIYGFLFELWVLNLKEEEKEKKNSAHHSPIHLYMMGRTLVIPIQSTTVLCDILWFSFFSLNPSISKTVKDAGLKFCIYLSRVQ